MSQDEKPPETPTPRVTKTGASLRVIGGGNPAPRTPNTPPFLAPDDEGFDFSGLPPIEPPSDVWMHPDGYLIVDAPSSDSPTWHFQPEEDLPYRVPKNPIADLTKKTLEKLLFGAGKDAWGNTVVNGQNWRSIRLKGKANMENAPERITDILVYGYQDDWRGQYAVEKNGADLLVTVSNALFNARIQYDLAAYKRAQLSKDDGRQ